MHCDLIEQPGQAVFVAFGEVWPDTIVDEKNLPAQISVLRLAPDYRLSQTVEACLPCSPPRYRQFYEEVLQPGALLGGVPV